MSIIKVLRLLQFQFTRPRGARRADVRYWRARRTVSIHAPARGATKEGAKPPLHPVVSIHAPARGATKSTPVCVHADRFQFTRPRGARPILAFIGIFNEEFQFTRPRGARPAPSATDLALVLVSIHAPARGATPLVVHKIVRTERFQFTRPRGARLGVPCIGNGGCSFNSRAREGRD